MTIFASGNILRGDYYLQAASLIKQALVIAEKSNGPNHASLSPILDSYSEVLAKLNRNTEAASVSSRAKYIRGT